MILKRLKIKPLAPAASLLLLLPCLLWSNRCLADTVILKHGGRFSGKVTDEYDGKVVLEVPSGTITFRSDEIRQIEYEDTGGSALTGSDPATPPGQTGETGGQAAQAKIAQEYVPPPSLKDLARIAFEEGAAGKDFLKDFLVEGEEPVPVPALLAILAVQIGLYIFFAYCLKKICEKAGSKPGVMIWIPVLQIFPLLRAANMSCWMVLLMIIPIVNIIVSVVMWVNICKARGKSPWLVILFFIPLLNVGIIIYLAFSE
ncbi:MAG: DUF5684 domain-containing protein [Candidatus Tritonobacter lacicola]|nr:DUF5684 domain-containing protein [Candidatus Tritonobacter lacicola]